MPEPISVWPFYGELAQALVPELGRDAVFDGQRLRPLWTAEVLEPLFGCWARSRGVHLITYKATRRFVAYLIAPGGARVIGRGQHPAEALGLGWLALLRHPALTPIS